ncbi:putative holin-like toxin [Streptococcus halichoeri]|nr:putative holin-like toxin [Streptococcus halichoeri]
MSTYEIMHLMIEFGSFLLSLIGLMIVIVKVSNKK